MWQVVKVERFVVLDRETLGVVVEDRGSTAKQFTLHAEAWEVMKQLNNPEGD